MPDYGQNIRQIMNQYRDRLDRLAKADDLLPGPKNRRIAQLKLDTRQQIDQAMQAAESQMQQEWLGAWRRANADKVRTLSSAEVTNAGVIKELRTNQLREDILRELQRPETSAADMLAEYHHLGFKEAAELVRRYEAEFARDAQDRDDFNALVDQLNPGRKQAREDLKQLGKEQDAARQGLTLLRDSAYSATALSPEEDNSLHGVSSDV